MLCLKLAQLELTVEVNVDGEYSRGRTTGNADVVLRLLPPPLPNDGVVVCRVQAAVRRGRQFLTRLARKHMQAARCEGKSGAQHRQCYSLAARRFCFRGGGSSARKGMSSSISSASG